MMITVIRHVPWELRNAQGYIWLCFEVNSHNLTLVLVGLPLTTKLRLQIYNLPAPASKVLQTLDCTFYLFPFEP